MNTIQPIPIRAPRSPDHFWAFVDSGAPGDCWPWTGQVGQRRYGVVQVREDDGRRRTIYAHRIAFWLSTGQEPGEGHVLHACDNPVCCNPAHLSLGNHAENMRQMRERGRSPRGVRNGQAKLTDPAVRAIGQLYAGGGWRQQDLADLFGVTQGQVSRVVNARAWVHVPVSTTTRKAA